MKKFLILCITLVALNAHAEFSPSGKITEIYSDGYWALVKVDNPNKENPSECSNVSYYGLNLTSERDNTLMSMLLAAEMAQKPVSFWIAGCEGQGNNYPGIISMKLFQ